MAYTYYKATTDDGGTIGIQIASGEVNALFDLLTIAQQTSGISKNRKMYIESDADITAYIGLKTTGLHDSTVFESSGDAQVVGDLTGSEDKYGCAVITASTTTTFTFDNTLQSEILFRAGDKLVYDNVLYDITSVVTDTVTFSPAMSATPTVGNTITSVFEFALLAGVPKSLWRKNVYPSSVASVSEYNSVDILIKV